MKITKFLASDGSTIAVTDSQQIALERAGLWRGYILFTQHPSGQPTHTDAEIADRIGASAKMTRIARKHRPYADTAPFLVVDPRGVADIACASMTGALDAARESGACIVTMDAADIQPAFYGFARERKITLLAV